MQGDGACISFSRPELLCAWSSSPSPLTYTCLHAHSSLTCALPHTRQEARTLTTCRDQPISKGNVAPLATSIAITMASRIVLNLRRSSAYGSTHPKPFSAPSSRGIQGVGVGRNHRPRVEALPVFVDAEAGSILDIRAALDNVGAADEDRRTDHLWSAEQGGERRQWPPQRTGDDVELGVLK